MWLRDTSLPPNEIRFCLLLSFFHVVLTRFSLHHVAGKTHDHCTTARIEIAQSNVCTQQYRSSFVRLPHSLPRQQATLGEAFLHAPPHMYFPACTILCKRLRTPPVPPSYTNQRKGPAGHADFRSDRHIWVLYR
ncbi:hypothetical protein QBC35DRAFT_482774 [Podospora australis]|uniref:Secreted protein n=1 Tax=Podospora australis TaxID=1536484 RepID=A0AAN6X3G2_9PEZI|nr:hypothetical protein QBC35DRAFT_482774 [Podospora australis]